MNFPAIQASLPLASLHPGDALAAAIPAGNGIPAFAFFDAEKECDQRQLLRENFDNAVTVAELSYSKRRLDAVRRRNTAVHYEGGPPLGNDGAAVVLQAVNALTASVNALTATVNANHVTATANHAALTGTVNAMATHTFRTVNNEKVRYGTASATTTALLCIVSIHNLFIRKFEILLV
jgi:hypothetical protein